LNGDRDGEELARHEASPPGVNPTEREQIGWKQRQNTLAARKSQKRKLEHQQRLEEDVKSLRRERDCWRTRAGVLQLLLASYGVPSERWQNEECESRV
jgi:Basic region leucine zipper